MYYNDVFAIKLPFILGNKATMNLFAHIVHLAILKVF